MTAASATPAVEAIALTRLFGDQPAVDGLDLLVPAGVVYGLLGPNGAGKTTTIRMLATLLRPDGGSARVFGFDVTRQSDAVRRHVSLTGQFASLDGDLTCLENLVLIGRLLGLPRRTAGQRAAQLLGEFDLADAAGRQVMKLSGGMRRRLDIAASLITRPDLLFLDEPTTGLDPQSRRRTWDMVREIVRAGTTVLLTTQYLDEADRLSDRIAVIDDGRLLAEGTSSDLKAMAGAGALELRLLDPGRRREAECVLASVLGNAAGSHSDPGSLSARLTGVDGEASARAAHAIAELDRAGIGLRQFSLAQPTLDEAFLALVRSHPHHVDGPASTDGAARDEAPGDRPTSRK